MYFYIPYQLSDESKVVKHITQKRNMYYLFKYLFDVYDLS